MDLTAESRLLAEEILGSLGGGDQEAARLRAVRDGYKAAAQTAAAFARRMGATKDEIAMAVRDAAEPYRRAAERNDLTDTGQARLQADGCKAVCERLIGKAAAYGADPTELMGAVRDAVLAHLQLKEACGVSDLLGPGTFTDNPEEA